MPATGLPMVARPSALPLRLTNHLGITAVAIRSPTPVKVSAPSYAVDNVELPDLGDLGDGYSCYAADESREEHKPARSEAVDQGSEDGAHEGCAEGTERQPDGYHTTTPAQGNRSLRGISRRK